MTRRLTELTLARVTPPSTGRLELADSQLPGMSCRVTADGIKTFALRYRVDGRQRRLTLGRYPIVGLAEARRRAREALALVERGIDPASAKIEEQAARDRNTVAAVVAAYVERRLKPRTRRWADVEAMLRRDVIRAWGTRPIASITWRDVCDLIEDITGRRSPSTARMRRSRASERSVRLRLRRCGRPSIRWQIRLACSASCSC
jgi:Arm DNA-binding domain